MSTSYVLYAHCKVSVIKVSNLTLDAINQQSMSDMSNDQMEDVQGHEIQLVQDAGM